MTTGDGRSGDRPLADHADTVKNESEPKVEVINKIKNLLTEIRGAESNPNVNEAPITIGDFKELLNILLNSFTPFTSG